MNLEFKNLLPDNFSDNSRVWVYQSSRLLSLPEALDAEELINNFVAEWHAHGASVKAYGNLFFGQFLILMADETDTTVSGCSTDSSVRFVKDLGQKFGVDFFNRSMLAFVINDKLQQLPLGQLAYAVHNNFITPDTLYFNNTVLTKKDLENNWLVPVKNTWLAQRLKLQPQA